MTRRGAPASVRRRRWLAALLGAVLALSTTAIAFAAGDPYRPQQWHLDSIGAPDAWPASRGQGVVIAVVDSGVNLTHPDLVDRFIRTPDGQVKGRDFVDTATPDVPEDEHGHGTMVSGIAVATMDNGFGVAGVANRARLLPVRVLDKDGRGSQSNVDAGIRWAVDNGADVINLSLEAALPLPGVLGSGAPVAAVQYAWDRGVVVVAAAGNSGTPFSDYPNSSPVVLVGSTNDRDRRSSFSDGNRADMIMAPGENIVSTWCKVKESDAYCRPDTHTFGVGSGTSYSAPQVAAGVAMMLELGMDHRQAIDQLRSTARGLDDSRTGVGLLDLAAATVGFQPAAPDPSPLPSPTASPTPSPTASPAPSPSPSPTPRPTPSPPPSSAEPEPTDTPEPSPSPTEEVTPDPSPSPTEPDPEPSIAVDLPVDDDPDGARRVWGILAVALVALNAGVLGRAWLTRG